MNFSQNLKLFMDRENLTAYKLSKELGVHQTTIRNWLDGKMPNATYLSALADYFKTTVDDLINDNTPYTALKEHSMYHRDIVTTLTDLVAESGLSDETIEQDLNLPKNTINDWRSRRSRTFIFCLPRIADYFNVSEAYLLGSSEIKQKTTLDVQEWLKENAIPVGNMKPIPVIGVIRAGMPMLAEENIEYYDFADVSDANDYFYLRVSGDSMIGAGIAENSIVLIKKQNSAENGQIVACLVNGEDATLKRFKQQGKTVLLMPENSKYEPIVLSCDDFDNGYAKILGVAKEVKVKLQ